YREPQTCPAIESTGGCGSLLEGFEQACVLVGGNADSGIGDLKLKEESAALRSFGRRDLGINLAVSGKFNCIAHQVSQYLAQASGVSADTKRKRRING